MKAKTKFIKMYYKLPPQARTELLVDAFTNPMTLKVCFIEVRNGTELGKKILNNLGYKDDLPKVMMLKEMLK